MERASITESAFPAYAAAQPGDEVSLKAISCWQQAGPMPEADKAPVRRHFASAANRSVP